MKKPSNQFSKLKIQSFILMMEDDLIRFKLYLIEGKTGIPLSGDIKKMTHEELVQEYKLIIGKVHQSSLLSQMRGYLSILRAVDGQNPEVSSPLSMDEIVSEMISLFSSSEHVQNFCQNEGVDSNKMAKLLLDMKTAGNNRNFELLNSLRRYRADIIALEPNDE